MTTGQEVAVSKTDGSLQNVKITKLFSFDGLKRTDISETTLGDIVAIAGSVGITIGESITNIENLAPLPVIKIDEPYDCDSVLGEQLAIRWPRRSVRDEPQPEGAAGEGTADHRSRLWLKTPASPETSGVLGRGELQLSVLIEIMRREGFELMVSRPEIVTKRIDDKLMEPNEHLTVDIPESFVGTVIERLGPRKGEMTKMTNHGSGRVRMEFMIPSRGLIGLRSEMLTETRGTIIMNSIADGYVPYQGEIPQRPTGALVSDRNGTTTTYALNGLQDRGILFVGDGTEVYEGMVVGEHSRDNDLDVNAVREKKLTNMRASGSDDALRLVPYKQQTLEQAIEFIADDELWLK